MTVLEGVVMIPILAMKEGVWNRKVECVTLVLNRVP